VPCASRLQAGRRVERELDERGIEQRELDERRIEQRRVDERGIEQRRVDERRVNERWVDERRIDKQRRRIHERGRHATGEIGYDVSRVRRVPRVRVRRLARNRSHPRFGNGLLAPAPQGTLNVAAASTLLTTRARAKAPVLVSPADAPLVGVATAHAVALAAIVTVDPRGALAAAFALLVGLGTVYTSNTVSHWHLHRPIFASRAASRAFSIALSVVLFVPQTAWAQRHLWHHAGEPAGGRALRMTQRLATEVACIVAALAALAAFRPYVLFLVVAPGFVLGMLLSAAQGHFEHAGDDDLRRSGVSHYGRLYNALWFNDGYHAEHHRAPATHWTDLPQKRRDPPRTSARAPLWRWLDAGLVRAAVLCLLERAVLRSRLLERWILRCHARALAALLADVAEPRRVAVVGGGLFPRTALALAFVAPEAEVVIVDASRESLSVASRTLTARGARAPQMVHARFDPERHAGFDLVVFPLAFVGDRTLVARARARNRYVITHDWMTTRAPRSRVVSIWLWKRMNLYVA
jgi:hypothetical protein